MIYTALINTLHLFYFSNGQSDRFHSASFRNVSFNKNFLVSFYSVFFQIMTIGFFRWKNKFYVRKMADSRFDCEVSINFDSQIDDNRGRPLHGILTQNQLY